jgi:hypothetical protein
MNVVEIFVPVYDNNGKRFSETLHKEVKAGLLEKFDGLTRYTRNPAEGLWRRGKALSRDAIIIYEVMVNRFNKRWWQRYRKDLEREFRQKSIVIRCFNIKLI